MKQLLVLIWCCVFLLVPAGCKDTGKQDRGSEETVVEPVPPRGEVEVVVEGNGEFPEFLVGVWQAQMEQGEWAFKFEPDGSISKIAHSLAGWVDVVEDRVYLEGPEPGTYATFAMGPCEANYDMKTRELRVTIILAYYQLVLPQEQSEGSAYDFFIGPVSEDGKRWTASWQHFDWLEGADFTESDLPIVQLIFTKATTTSRSY